MRRRGVESKVKVVQLGDVCAIVGGGTPRRNNEAYFRGAIPWATPTDVTALNDLSIARTKETITEAGLRESSARLVPAGTVLLTSRATIGYTAIAERPMATNQGFANFICGECLVPEYLAYWLRGQRDHLIRLAGGTTFREISKSTLKGIPIPLPPLAEQRRIAGILNRAARIERLRARGADRFHTFAPALFVKMFDNLSGNGCDKSVPLDDLSVSLESGFACGKSKLVENGILHLRPFNIGSNGELYLKNTYKIPHSLASKSKSFVHSGDILFNNTNSRDLVGKVALVHENLEAGFSNHITRIRLDQTRCEPTFLTGYLRYLWQHGFFRDRCTQWVSQAAYGPRLLARMPIPIPPLAVQRQFTDICKQAASIANNARSASKAASALTASLMDRLLDGDPAPGRSGAPGPA